MYVYLQDWSVHEWIISWWDLPQGWVFLPHPTFLNYLWFVFFYLFVVALTPSDIFLSTSACLLLSSLLSSCFRHHIHIHLKTQEERYMKKMLTKHSCNWTWGKGMWHWTILFNFMQYWNYMNKNRNKRGRWKESELLSLATICSKYAVSNKRMHLNHFVNL